MAAGGFPTYEQVVELPAEFELAIPHEFEDEYGHLNVRHYFDLNNKATTSLIWRIGVDNDYLHKRRCGMFTVEHHISYCSEVLVGDTVSCHVRLVERSPRAVHGFAVMVDHDTRLVANILEFALVHVDLDTRKAVPYGASVAHAIENELERGRRLTWPTPVIGAIGVRAG